MEIQRKNHRETSPHTWYESHFKKTQVLAWVHEIHEDKMVR